MSKIAYLLSISLMISLLECRTIAAATETPESIASMRVTRPIVTPYNRPAYLWVNSVKLRV